MKHKKYVEQIRKEKALHYHNKNHRDKVDQDCRYCNIFPKAIFAIVS